VLIARDGEVLHAAQAGYADIESERPFTPATPVLIASMTKPVTALAVMQLVENGAIALDQPLSDFIPAFGDVEVAVSPIAGDDGAIETVPLERPVTIHDLLTHTAGLGYVFDAETNLGRLNIEHSLYAHPGPLSEAAAALAEVPLYMQPGTRWFYSWSNDVLGAVVEAASGRPLDVYMEAEIFEPLGMETTGFYLEAEADRSQLATVYTHAEDGSLIPRIVAGEALEGPQAFQVPAGGAGLVSTAEDYMRFALMLAGGGALDGVRVIEADTLEAHQMHEEWIEVPAPTIEATRPVLSATDLGSWTLGKFQRVAEVKAALSNQPVALDSIDLLGGAETPFHYVLHDRSGEAVVLDFDLHSFRPRLRFGSAAGGLPGRLTTRFW